MAAVRQKKNMRHGRGKFCGLWLPAFPHSWYSGCLVPCTREIWVTEVEEENIYWKTVNWSSEFVLQAKSGRTEVYFFKTR